MKEPDCRYCQPGLNQVWFGPKGVDWEKADAALGFENLDPIQRKRDEDMWEHLVSHGPVDWSRGRK